MVRRCDRCGVEISRISNVDNATDEVKSSIKNVDDSHRLAFSKMGSKGYESESMDLCDKCREYVFDLLAAEKKSWNKDEDKDEKDEVLHK